MGIAVDASSPSRRTSSSAARIAVQVAGGELPAGTRLPTVRQLAADLGLAANTVARAYRELEADGVIATHGRRGTFVSSTVLAEGRPDGRAGRRVRRRAPAARA